MFLVCDKITHLHKLPFSWSYDQENNTLPIDLPELSISWYNVCLKALTGESPKWWELFQKSAEQTGTSNYH